MARPKKPAEKVKDSSVTVRIERALHEAFQRLAEADDLDVSDLARRALREYARRRKAA